MTRSEKMLFIGFINHAIAVFDKFVAKAETARDLKEIKEEAEFLKKWMGGLDE